jgi:hypothetical protein
METAELTLQPVKSSMFTHAGYDADTFTLSVRFRPTRTEPEGPLWRYHDVGEELADDFFKADSLGDFFAQNIKHNHFAEHISQPGGADLQRGAIESVAAEPAAPEPVDEDDLKLAALAIEAQVRSLTITSPDEYARACAELIHLRDNRKTAQARVDRIKLPAYATYKAALELEKQVIGPYTQAENFLNAGMSDYRAHEKAQRAAEERRLTEERRQAAEAAARHQAAVAREAAAQSAKNHQSADAVRQEPLQFHSPRVQSVVLPTEVPRVKGIVERAPVWKWRVLPGQEHLIPREYLQLNEVAINAAVRSQKGLTHIAGIEVWDEEAKVQVKGTR